MDELESGNYQPRLSCLLALLQHLNGIPRAERAMNQIEKGKEKRKAEMDLFNKQPVMKLNKQKPMGETTYSAMLTKLSAANTTVSRIYGEGQSALESTLEEYNKKVICKGIWAGNNEWMGVKFLTYFGIKNPGLKADHVTNDISSFHDIVVEIFEEWSDLAWDQSRSCRLRVDGSIDESDELPASKRDRKKTLEAEETAKLEQAELEVSKGNRKRKNEASSASSSSSAPSTNATVADEVSAMKKAAIVAAAKGPVGTAAVMEPLVSMMEKIQSNRDAREDAKDLAHAAREKAKEQATAEHNKTDAQKALELLSDPDYCENGAVGVTSISAVLLDVGVKQADELSLLEQEELDRVLPFLKKIPRKKLVKLLGNIV